MFNFKPEHLQILISEDSFRSQSLRYKIKNYYCHARRFNPLSLHDALKHQFTSLKTDLIFPELTLLKGKFPWNSFINIWQFSLFFHPLQLIFINYKLRIATAIRGL